MGLTLPILFPICSQPAASTGLIMRDGLTRAMPDVGSRLQTWYWLKMCRRVGPERAKLSDGWLIDVLTAPPLIRG
jgi:hypothetical protein